jgi:regulatory protein
LDALAATDLQSDRRYAEGYCRARAAQGFGPVRIRGELASRGVDHGLIDEILDASGEDWAEKARFVRRKRFGAREPEDFSERARQMRFLEYRGFGHAQIRAALGAAVDDV